MSSITGNTAYFVDRVIKESFESYGPQPLFSEPKRGATCRGYDDAGKECEFCFPTVVLAHTASASNDYSLVFTKDYKKDRILLRCVFDIIPTLTSPNVVPLRLLKPEIDLLIAGQSAHIKLTVSSSMLLKKAFGSVYLSITEFENLTRSLSKGDVYFSWKGDLYFYNAKEGNIKDKVLAKEKVESLRTVTISGKTDTIVIPSDNTTTYGSIRGAMDWDREQVGEFEVWFKDTMKKGQYHMLPQLFWIKANPRDNKPLVKAVFTKETEGMDIQERPIRFQFEIAPYYDPRAKRNLYEILTKRSGGSIKYCRLAYGGFKEISFEWDPDFVGKYKDIGIDPTPIKLRDLDVVPQSSFTLSLDVKPGSIDYFMELLKEGIKVADVSIDKSINLEVVLNIHRLSQLQLVVKVLERPEDEKEFKFPYSAEILNAGEFGLEIRGCEISVLSEKKSVTKDAIHNLESDVSWPRYLPGKESLTVSLSQSEKNRLKENSKILGIIPGQKWTTLLCEPCNIYLTDEDVQSFFDTGFYLNAYQPKDKWIVSVILSLSESPLKKISQVEVQLRTSEGELPAFVLKKGAGSREIEMSKTLNFLLFPELRKYEYHFRVDTGTGYGEWSEWAEGPAEGSLRLIDDIVEPYIK